MNCDFCSCEYVTTDGWFVIDLECTCPCHGILCPFCNQDTGEETLCEVEVETVAGKIKATVPLLTCGSCGESWTDSRGEKLIDEAAIANEVL